MCKFVAFVGDNYVMQGKENEKRITITIMYESTNLDFILQLYIRYICSIRPEEVIQSKDMYHILFYFYFYFFF